MAVFYYIACICSFVFLGAMALLGRKRLSDTGELIIFVVAVLAFIGAIGGTIGIWISEAMGLTS